MSRFYVRVRTREQLQMALTWGETYALLLEPEAFKGIYPGVGTADRHRKTEQNTSLLKEWQETGNEICPGGIYLCLPDVARQSRIFQMERLMAEIPETVGVVVKNLDELGILHEMDFQGQVIGDSFLYAYNSPAVSFYLDLFPQMRFLCSDELTDTELGELRKAASDRFIYKAYGYQPLMISNQCINRNYYSCQQSNTEFRDEKGHRFTASGNCEFCCSTIYNGQRTYMLDRMDEILFENLLLDFTIESAEETWQTLKQAGMRRKAPELPVGTITRGHHYKGID